MKCKLCKKEFKHKLALSTHISRGHSDIISPEEYCVKYKVHPKGMCVICSMPTEFISYSKGFKKTCGDVTCSNLYKKQRTIEAMLNKHGVINASQLPGHMDKVRKSNLERYGVEHYTNPEAAQKTCLDRYGAISYTGTEEYSEKYKQTCLDRYGVEHHTQSESVKEKNRQTCLDRYGVEHTLQDPEIRKRIEETVNEKYGGFTLESEELREKYKATMMERYGVENPLQNDEIKDKVHATNIERYGTKSPLQNKKILNRIYGVDNINRLGWVVDKQKENRAISLMAKYGIQNVSQLGWVQDKIVENNIEKYGAEHTSQLDWVQDKSRQTCLKRYGVSNPAQNEEILNKIFSALSRKPYRIREYELLDGRIIHYQSDAELTFIRKCENAGIEIYDGIQIEYEHNDKFHMYFVDFKIKENDTYRLIEIKAKHKWWYDNIKTGKALAKIQAAQDYSKGNGYLPYKIKFAR